MKFKVSKENFIYLMILLNPVFEIAYNILPFLGIDVPINQFCRMFMFLAFIFCIKDRRTLTKISIITIVLIVLWFTQVMIGITQITFGEIVFLIKIIYATSLPFIFESFIRTNVVKSEGLSKTTVLSTYIIIFSICVSPLGWGFKAWENIEYRMGYTGWFGFGNYLTASLLASFGILLCSNNIKNKKVWIILTVAALILTGNKAALLGIVGYIIALLIFYILYKRSEKVNRIWFSIGVVVFPAAVFAVFSYMIRYVGNQLKLYDLYRFTRVSTFLLSNRDLQIEVIRKNLNSGLYADWGKVIGYGYSNVINCLELNKRGDALEMDIYALFYYMGIIPAMIWIIIYFKAAYKSIINFLKTKNENDFVIATGIVISILHSVITGHVIFESLTIVYIAVLISISNTNFTDKRVATKNQNYGNKV